MKVLIGAYACEPGEGSEPGVGWNWAIQAARHGHEVHVITRSNNRHVIEASLGESPVPGLSFHYCDLPGPFLKLKKRAGYYGLVGYYYFWQFWAWRLARRLHAEHRFDIAHHVTFVNDWMPSGVGLIDAAFLWGPVGGSTNVIPRRLREFIPRSARRYEFIRRAAQTLLSAIDPFVWLTRRRARMIFTFTREALAGIPSRYRAKARPVIHIGISPADVNEPTTVPGSGVPFTVVSGSRLVHWKGFDLLIEGFSQHVRRSDSTARLLITGNGPFRGALEDLISSLGVEDCVELLGHLPARSDVYRLVAGADLYALPTLRDGPPVAILEAMLRGRPILCLNRAATAELVPADAGFKIDVSSRPQVVRDIGDALSWAAEHPSDLAARGKRARERALSYHDWGRIGDMIDAAYTELMYGA